MKTHEARVVRNGFKPAVLAANEAIAKLPKDRRPAALPDGRGKPQVDDPVS